MIWPLLLHSQPANRYDIVIDEIMAHPSPPQGLPNAEWLELRNRTDHPINLQRWQLMKQGVSATITKDVSLLPDSVIILCSVSASAQLLAFGKCIGLSSFPSLGNEEDQLALVSAEGATIHAVSYNLHWYHNEVKKEGGWSIEMIDPGNPCGGMDNWRASENDSGGTPGRLNSVNAPNPDELPPKLIRGYASDSNQVMLIFNEPVDSSSSNPAGYEWMEIPGNTISVSLVAPLFNSVSISLRRPLKKNKIYHLQVSGLQDCVGNQSVPIRLPVGRSETPDSFDVVIDEILFDPYPGGVDYIELYNRSNKVLNLGELVLANLNARGEPASLSRITEGTVAWFPGQYALFTEDTMVVQRQYSCRDPSALFETSSLPSWPNDQGSVLVFGSNGVLLDQLRYDAKWHFPLLADPEGVSLERIFADAPTQDQHNWHSAATQAGYGTPGYQNSASRNSNALDAAIGLSPRIVSPDGDGHDDFAVIDYQFPEAGYMCSITIFDATGMSVRKLVQTALCGTKGQFIWDGLSDQQAALPMGIYIVSTQIFTLQGKTKKYKNIITLARKY